MSEETTTATPPTDNGNNIYLLLFGECWEDATVYLNEADAIEISKFHPKYRVEIFAKTNTSLDTGYRPTYSYIKNGQVYRDNNGIYDTNSSSMTAELK